MRKAVSEVSEENKRGSGWGRWLGQEVMECGLVRVLQRHRTNRLCI